MGIFRRKEKEWDVPEMGAHIGHLMTGQRCAWINTKFGYTGINNPIISDITFVDHGETVEIRYNHTIINPKPDKSQCFNKDSFFISVVELEKMLKYVKEGKKDEPDNDSKPRI